MNPGLLISFETASPLMLPPYGAEGAALNQLAAGGTVWHEYYSTPVAFEQAMQDLQEKLSDENIEFCTQSFSGQERLPLPDLALFTHYQLPALNVELLQQVEQLIAEALEHLTKSDSPFCIICTSKSGELLTWTDPAVGFAEAAEQSLTVQQWSPLMVHWVGSHHPPIRSQQLATPAAWGQLFDLKTAELLQETIGGILLEGETQIGYRVPDRLLVVPRELDSASDEAAVLEQCQLFVKPDDRFDVNDIAQSEPDRCFQLWNELKAFM